ncbi:MAG: DUF2934 domain-containing protein [Nibricoccus sp.]
MSSRPEVVPSHEEVSRRAFEIWLQEGQPHGRDMEHWYQAERQLLGLTPSPTTEIPAQRPAITPEDRSLSSKLDDSTPYSAFEDVAPLSTKVERNLSGMKIKGNPASSASVNVDSQT